MSETALQVYLQKICCDRPMMKRRVWAYAVSTARTEVDGQAQVFFSNPPFRTAPRDGKRKNADLVHAFAGDGQLLFTGPAEGFDQLELHLYLVQDRSQAPEDGEILQELFDDGGAGTKFVNDVASLGSDVLEKVGDAVAMAQPAGQVLQLAGGAIGLIGRAMQNKGDRVRIHATGTVMRETLLKATEGEGIDTELDWGLRNPSDKGFYRLKVIKREVSDASAAATMITLPDIVTARLDHFLEDEPSAALGADSTAAG